MNGIESKPGRQEIALRLQEWVTLKESILQLHATMPALAEALPSAFSVGHSNRDRFPKV